MTSPRAHNLHDPAAWSYSGSDGTLRLGEMTSKPPLRDRFSDGGHLALRGLRSADPRLGEPRGTPGARGVPRRPPPRPRGVDLIHSLPDVRERHFGVLTFGRPVRNQRG